MFITTLLFYARAFVALTGSQDVRLQKGQGLVEYALVLVLVAVVIIAILTLLGPQIGNVFSQITCGLSPDC